MTIGKVASAAVNQAVQSADGGKAKFGETFKQVTKQPAKVSGNAVPGQNATTGVASQQNVKVAAPVKAATSNVKTAQAAKVVDQVTAAQERLDKILALAQSGKVFTPAELLALQAQVCNASQQLDLAGKVVEKTTGGVKQVLQTQL